MSKHCANIPFEFFGKDEDRQLAVDIYNIFPKTNKPHEITISVFDNPKRIELSRHSDFLILTYGILRSLSEVLKTEDFRIENDYTKGCDTCDYGSSYKHVIVIPNLKGN